MTSYWLVSLLLDCSPLAQAGPIFYNHCNDRQHYFAAINDCFLSTLVFHGSFATVKITTHITVPAVTIRCNTPWSNRDFNKFLSRGQKLQSRRLMEVQFFSNFIDFGESARRI